MHSVGVRELKQHTTQILRRVREQGETIDVTYQGQVVARLVPVRRSQPDRSEANADVWADLDRLAEEIGARWPSGVSAADAVREAWREL